MISSRAPVPIGVVFLLTLGVRLYRVFNHLTSDKRESVLIIDDSTYDRSRSRMVELLSRVRDHTTGRFVRGFRMLTLCWSDGVSCLPLDFVLLSSTDAAKRLCDSHKAERARIAGNRLDAMEAYRESLRLARENKYLNEDALANELCAKFYLSLNDEKVARLYMTDAYYCYLQWEAKAKIDDPERTFPELLSRLPKKESKENATDVMPMKREYGTDDLDLSTIMKAAQALSEEIVLDALLEKMMKIMIENADAQRGELILKEDILRIEAEGFISEDRFTRLSSLPVSDCPELPAGIIYYVFRKAESVIPDNASERHSLMDDPYFQKREKKSILCEPIIHHGRTVGVLYLENDLITGAFTKERVELLRLFWQI